jgi:hypothetical protein
MAGPTLEGKASYLLHTRFVVFNFQYLRNFENKKRGPEKNMPVRPNEAEADRQNENEKGVARNPE